MTLRTRRRLVTVMSGSMAGGAPPVDAPGGVEAGLSAWWKADSLSLANGAPVTTWPDSGPNDLDVTQGTAANQPTYITSAFNNKPAVSFDGNDGLVKPAVLGSYIADTDKQTMFFVQRQIEHTTQQVTAHWIGDGSAALTLHALYVDHVLYWDVGHFASARLSRPGAPGHDSWHIFELFRAPTTAEAVVDGTSLGTSSYTTGINPALSAALGIGSTSTLTFGFHGEIAELIIYTRQLTSTERDSVRNYLMSKYGIAPSKILDELATGPGLGGYLLLEDGNVSNNGRLALEAA